MDPLDKAIEDLVNLLNPAGRICIITFHSLDRTPRGARFRRCASR
ncbi:16S rRNA (cytosine(1402)-N(4))-methyltransferase [Klebsiella pneumoniae]|nr:16S rRNA (cytosine(1402)-N(4))-methyltransferase [Klebsiella pneumoniae]